MELPKTKRERRTPLWICGGLALFWIVFTLSTAKRPDVAFGGWGSDHYSHISATRLFLEYGPRIYTQPILKLCRPVTPERLPAARTFAKRLGIPLEGVCLPKENGRPPLAINWQWHPRPYPPGQLLFFLPVTLLVEKAGISFRTANSLILAQFLLMVHLCLLVLWRILGPVRPRILSWSVLGVAYWHLLLWTLQGFYDPVGILCVFLAFDDMRKKNGSRAFFWLSLSVFLHFRALWHLPALLYAFHMTRDKPRERDRPWFWIPPSVGMLLASGIVFLLLLPWLGRFDATSPVHVRVWGEHLSALALFFAGLGGLAVLYGIRGLSLGAATAAWCAFMIVMTPQIMHWHGLWLLPLLLVPVNEKSPTWRGILFAAGLASYALLSHVVFESVVWRGLLSMMRDRLAG